MEKEIAAGTVVGMVAGEGEEEEVEAAEEVGSREISIKTTTLQTIQLK